MTELNLNPTQNEKEGFGLLAHVNFSERQRVLALPAARRKRYMDYLQKRLDKERKVKR